MRNRLVSVGCGGLVASALVLAGATANAFVVGPFMTAATAVMLGIITESPTALQASVLEDNAG